MIEPTAKSRVGRTEIELPRLGVGFSSLGGLFAAVEDDAACRVVEAALAAGIDYFDVAPSYGYGLAEERAGRALAGVDRAAFVLSTKVGKLVKPTDAHAPGDPFVGAPPGTTVFDFTADGLARSVEASLERLGIDAFDILFLHDPDNHLEAVVDDAFPELARWRDEGVVRAIGFGMNDAAALEWLVRRTEPDVILAANCYTLLDRSAATALFPLCQRRRIAVVAGGPFSSGILADPTGRPFYRYRPAPPAVVSHVEALQAIAEAHGVPLRIAALQFVARHPVVSSVLVGVRDTSELDDALAALRTDVTDALWAAFDQIAHDELASATF